MNDYVVIEKKYGEQLWQMYLDLENDEIKESGFYSIIERADNEHYKLDGKLGNLLENYL